MPENPVEAAPPPELFSSLPALIEQGGPFVVFSLVLSVILTTIAIERGLQVMRYRAAIHRLDAGVMESARAGKLEDARRTAESLSSPVREVVTMGLDRALGRVLGDAATAMRREHKRGLEGLKSYVWMLGSAGSLMPFVGLLGTVIGVMGSFAAIGEKGTGGFGVVSAGLAEALIATAAGLAVALEAVVYFNVLQNAIGRSGRELGFLIDELIELIDAGRRSE
jgi:biopolymer transport protein ExbB